MPQIDEIYQQYASKVYRYLLSLTHDQDLAEELTQETFYQAILSVNRFEQKSSVSTWLCGIAKNVLGTYRKKNAVHEDIEDQSLPTRSAEEEIFSELGRLSLMKKLHVLPEPQREIVYLKALGGLSIREIAEIFNQSENWVRVNYFRGKERLRKELEKDE